MILEVVAAGLVISACLAIYLDEAIYSVVSLACTVILISLLYAVNGTVYVAVFQFAIGLGTLAVFFLSSEMLSEKLKKEKSTRNTLLIVALGTFMSFPAIFLSLPTIQTNISIDSSFVQALWNLRALDIVLQGLVMLTVALGIAIVLYERKRGES